MEPFIPPWNIPWHLPFIRKIFATLSWHEGWVWWGKVKNFNKNETIQISKGTKDFRTRNFKKKTVTWGIPDRKKIVRKIKSPKKKKNSKNCERKPRYEKNSRKCPRPKNDPKKSEKIFESKAQARKWKKIQKNVSRAQKIEKNQKKYLSQRPRVKKNSAKCGPSSGKNRKKTFWQLIHLFFSEWIENPSSSNTPSRFYLKKHLPPLMN